MNDRMKRIKQFFLGELLVVLFIIHAGNGLRMDGEYLFFILNMYYRNMPRCLAAFLYKNPANHSLN